MDDRLNKIPILSEGQTKERESENKKASNSIYNKNQFIFLSIESEKWEK